MAVASEDSQARDNVRTTTGRVARIGGVMRKRQTRFSAFWKTRSARDNHRYSPARRDVAA